MLTNQIQALAPVYSNKLINCLQLVAAWQRQKTNYNGTPYLGYSLQIAGEVLLNGASEEDAIAALCFGVKDVDIKLIESYFGEKVSRMVCLLQNSDILSVIENKNTNAGTILVSCISRVTYWKHFLAEGTCEPKTEDVNLWIKLYHAYFVRLGNPAQETDLTYKEQKIFEDLLSARNFSDAINMARSHACFPSYPLLQEAKTMARYLIDRFDLYIRAYPEAPEDIHVCAAIQVQDCDFWSLKVASFEEVVDLFAKNILTGSNIDEDTGLFCVLSAPLNLKDFLKFNNRKILKLADGTVLTTELADAVVRKIESSTASAKTK